MKHLYKYFETNNDINNTLTLNENNITNENIKNEDTNNDIENINENEQPQKVYKKRGRKPKGGKIIKQPNNIKNETNIKQNIILHLKCSISDVNENIFGINQSYNPNILENVGSFSFNDKELSYDYIKSKELVETENIVYSNKYYENVCNIGNSTSSCNSTLDNIKNISSTLNNYNTINDDINILNGITSKSNETLSNNKNNFIKSLNNINNTSYCKKTNLYDDEENTKVKDIWKKLSELEKSLHINDTSDKKSDCFWDTCEFDNPPIYIPKYELNGVIHVYGCFCSPECAVAFLMKENIDTTTKFERYHLLNHIYCKLYNYEKNIKPAPSPYYTLNRYYGNLTIQEYRKLLKNERLLLIVDKPLTRQLPELHQDNDDYIINNSIQSCSKYKLRRKGGKQSKNEILNENFGLSIGK
jgi:hypothetical protein